MKNLTVVFLQQGIPCVVIFTTNMLMRALPKSVFVKVFNLALLWHRVCYCYGIEEETFKCSDYSVH